MTATAEASCSWSAVGISFLSTTSVIPGGSDLAGRISLLGVGI
jgi:hypothetical protein